MEYMRTLHRDNELFRTYVTVSPSHSLSLCLCLSLSVCLLHLIRTLTNAITKLQEPYQRRMKWRQTLVIAN